MATYQKDITKNLTTAEDGTAAFAASIRSTGQQAAEAIRMGGEATAKTITAVGGTIWEAYKGVKEANLEVGLQKEVDSLQADVTAVKSADEAAKTNVELQRSAYSTMAEEVRAASILAGADPDEARTLSSNFFRDKENSAVAAFRVEQQRIIAARDSLPGRQREMMLRSETLLKSAIASMPGLANNFRKVAQEVTGKENLDLYSVNRLYEDISFIEKQTIANQKQQEAIRQQYQTAYVADRTKGGVGQVQALAEFNSLNSNEQRDLANASVTSANNKVAAKEALDAGGNQIVNVVTLTKTAFENDLLTTNANIYTQLQKLGVTKTMITTGTIPDTIASSPEYKRLIDEAGSKTLTLLDAQYQQLNASLIAAGKTNPIDSSKYREAAKDAKDWYDSSRKFYTENKTTFLHAMADQDFTKTAQQRMTLIDTFVKSLGLSDVVIASLGMSGNEAAKNEAKARYPREASMIEFANSVRRKAMMGVGEQEWQSLVKQIDSYKDGNREVPKTPEASTASLIDFARDSENLRKQVLSGTFGPNITSDVTKVISGAVLQPANADRHLKQNVTAVATAIAAIPASEKTAFINVINQNVNESLYGGLGHADTAKTRLTEYTTAYAAGGAVTTAFADPAGNQPLKLVATQKAQERKFAETGGGAVTGNPKLGTPIKVTPPTNVNNVLDGIDHVLRIQAMTTNQPIEKLRVNFINTFNQKGMPSEVFTSSLVDPTAGEAKDKAAQEAADAIDPGAIIKTPATPAVTSTPAPVAPIPASATPVSLKSSTNVDLDTQVRGALDKMKTIDPTMNTEYVYDAYKRATPAKQRELATLFKNNTVRMADLSGSN